RRTSTTVCTPPCRLRFGNARRSTSRERASLLLELAERFSGDAERVDGCGHAGIDRDLQQHLADLRLRRAVADRAFDVDFQLVRAIQRAQHRDVEQAASLLLEPFAAPDGAPAVL